MYRYLPFIIGVGLTTVKAALYPKKPGIYGADCHGNIPCGTVRVDKPHTDLLTGKTYTGEIPLQPWQTLVLQEL